MKRKRSWIKVIYIVQSGSLSRKYIPHSGRSSANPQPNCSICPRTENQTSYCQKPVCVEEEIWSHTKNLDLHLDTQEAVMSTMLLGIKVVPFKNRACGNTRENWNTTAPQDARSESLVRNATKTRHIQEDNHKASQKQWKTKVVAESVSECRSIPMKNSNQ